MNLPLKEQCSVYTVNGFMKGRLGQFRIIVLAKSQEDAAEVLGLSRVEACLFRVSRDTRDWTAYGANTAVGDVFVVPFGTHQYTAVDPDEVTLS